MKTTRTVQFSSVQSCLTLCDPMNRSTPGLPVQHQTASYKCGILDPIARSSDAVGFVVPVAVQSLSCVWLFMTPWTTACQASLSITSSWSFLKLMSIKSVMASISSSVVPFSSCLQSFPASGSFQMSQFFASGGQSIGVSTSTSVLPINIQD